MTASSKDIPNKEYRSEESNKSKIAHQKQLKLDDALSKSSFKTQGANHLY